MCPAGVAHRQAKEETIALAVGERRGACGVEGVLGGEHHEGPWQRHGRAVGGDLALLHRLEQGGLGSCRRPVQLVGHQHVGEDRARAERRVRPCPGRGPWRRSRRPAGGRR